MKNIICNSFDSLKKEVVKFYALECGSQKKSINNIMNDEMNKIFSTTTQYR